jgi:dihydrofolate reductase
MQLLLLFMLQSSLKFVINVKLFIGSSLDGYIAREDSSTDWLYTHSGYGYTQFYDSVDIIKMGRITYDKFLHSCMEYAHKDKKTFVFTQRKEKEKMIT